MEAITTFRGDYAFLSNFASLARYPGEPSYLMEETDSGLIHYPTVEHAYQASKTLDLRSRETISLLDTPVKAKRAGRNVRMRSNWDVIKDDVMLGWLRLKFSNPTLKRLLLDTYPRDIKHSNAHGDTYWGCDVFLEGKDVLGRQLVLVRDELRTAT